MQPSENTLLEIADLLRQSPAFRLSQQTHGRIEGFQSSFLAWLAEEYPEAVALWLRECLEIFTETIVRVRQESSGDYVLLFLDDEKTGHVVAVKHKIDTEGGPFSPSLTDITKETRETYGDRAQFLLFSLGDPSSMLPKHHPWTVCRYDYYAETLQTLRTRRHRHSDYYHAALLSDYVFTLRQYSRIHNLVAAIGNDEPLLGSIQKFLPLREIGLEWYAVRYRYESITDAISKRLETKPEINSSLSFFRRGDVLGDIAIHWGSWSPVTIEFGVSILVHTDDGKKSLTLNVDICDNQFCLCAGIGRDDAKLKQFAHTLRKENRWFTFQETPEIQALGHLWGEDSQTQDFCYTPSETFVYCYKSFAETVSANEIINAIVLFIQYAQKSFVEGKFKRKG